MPAIPLWKRLFTVDKNNEDDVQSIEVVPLPYAKDLANQQKTYIREIINQRSQKWIREIDMMINKSQGYIGLCKYVTIRNPLIKNIVEIVKKYYIDKGYEVEVYTQEYPVRVMITVSWYHLIFEEQIEFDFIDLE